MTQPHSVHIVSNGVNDTTVEVDGMRLAARDLCLRMGVDEMTEMSVTLLCGKVDVSVCVDDNDAMDNQE